MHRTPARLAIAIASLLAMAPLAACGSDEPSASEPSAAPTTTLESVTVESVSPATSTTPAPNTPAPTTPALELPAWQTVSMADVNGESFTVADFIGRPVLVETFATWCKNCRAQLGDTQAAAAELGGDAVVLALSVETDLSSADVADYAADNGFTDIRFAVMTPEALAAFVDAFGNTVANPPSTPKIVVDAMGHAGELSTGAESSDAIVQQVRGLAG